MAGFISVIPGVGAGKARAVHRDTSCAIRSNHGLEINISDIEYRPLEDKKIVFTASQGYATRYAALLTEAGARPLWCPMTEIRPFRSTVSFEAIDSALLTLHCYDFVVFSNRTAIEVFARRLVALANGDKDNAKGALASANAKLCTIGRDGNTLRTVLGRGPDVTPVDPSLIGLANHLSGLDNLEGSRILVLASRPEGLSELVVLSDFLKAASQGGASVERLDCCEIVPTSAKRSELERSLILAGDVDAIAFTTSQEVEAFANLLPAVALPPEVIISTLGPHTEALADYLGFKVRASASYFASFEGLMELITREIQRRNPPTGLILPS
mmetsp:Transcript_456/g.1580  ORF Transcript_456/g.1580 Transcript_456/m.1580 type:complete len:328 (+) Transcript_456:280-1263(+)|eukprot:CAMPEP_0198735302 /NCGR_PEP_ID=MMETSP1475-20131203/58515_1 /TAXON_ID= ORGANISM="Unidentified sp., Strain CCMP1999" /NCGR_SAMPLE_ID=MMETSP1475 /ASSEMBLY_ACC=CAM_ASM_001111 /LENGTH=327 /DNA_ID=CAMNT_0044498933 /DNA_START=228 /DNA_END=1211 /DNA_ORIENTATION=+